MIKNKGFTLIELLAVIVILAVIALISTPIVLNVIENAKEKANMSSANGLIDAGRLYYSESLLNEEKASKIKQKINLWDEIKTSGNKPKVGELYVNIEGEVALSVLYDDVCYQKTFTGGLEQKESSTCELGYEEPDEIAPTITFSPLGNPFNELRWAKEDFYVQIKVEDGESGGASYRWCTTQSDTCQPEAEIMGDQGTVLISSESLSNRICVIGRDKKGNESGKICSDTYKLDKTAPTFQGADDITFFMYSDVDLASGINMVDSLSGIEGSYNYTPTSINMNVVGNTTVTYKVKDKAGNETVKSRIVTLKAVTEASYFTFNVSTKTITGYSSSGPKEVIIPSQINGVPVLSIGNYAFQNKKLTSVIIPNSVTSIGISAFNNNQLPDNMAFIYARNSNGTEDNTKLISYGGSKRANVIIPASVESIGDYSFNSNQLASVTIPNGVTSIGFSAFSNNQLTSITIPSSVTSIGDSAFYYNQLTSVAIPSSVTSIGTLAFSSNQLPDNMAFIYARNSDGTEDKTKLINYGGAKKANVVIPTSVTCIGTSALSANQLTSVTIPPSVKIIENAAFNGNQLTSVTIPNSVTSIGYSAFQANQLTSVTIPSSVMNIGYGAFGDNRLTSVRIIGKTSSSQFITYGASMWGWASGYSDSNIIWNA